jgi:hypothetical protein
MASPLSPVPRAAPRAAGKCAISRPTKCLAKARPLAPSNARWFAVLALPSSRDRTPLCSPPWKYGSPAVSIATRPPHHMATLKIETVRAHLRLLEDRRLGPAKDKQPGIGSLQHGAVEGAWCPEPDCAVGVVQDLQPGERVHEDVEYGRARERQPQQHLGVHLACEEHLEASARVRAGRLRKEAVHPNVGRRGERPKNAVSESERKLDMLRHGMIEVDVRMEQPDAPPLGLVGVSGAVLHQGFPACWRGQQARRRYHGAAGTSPCVDITCSNFARSGGPPAAATAATSRKNCAPMSGVIITSARAVSPVRLRK